MPRYRKLHVKTTESLDLNEMPDDFTRLMWVLLPTALCREGRGLYSGAWLKSKLFPLREDINSEFVGQKFEWFIMRGMVVPYEIEHRAYFYVPTFHKYQGNTTKEAESDYPAPPAELPNYSKPTPELVQSKSTTDAVFNIQYSDADADANESGADAPPTPPADNGAGTSADYQEIRKAWLELMPDKPQPRANNKTLQGKVTTRMKSPHFRDNWLAAMERAAESTFLADGNWFDLGWFLQNDTNYEKCLNGNYDDKSQTGGRGSRASPKAPEPAGYAGIREWIESEGDEWPTAPLSSK